MRLKGFCALAHKVNWEWAISGVENALRDSCVHYTKRQKSTLRHSNHSFEAAKDRSGLNAPFWEPSRGLPTFPVFRTWRGGGYDDR